MGRIVDHMQKVIRNSFKAFSLVGALVTILALVGCGGLDLGGVFKDNGSGGFGGNSRFQNAQPAKVALLLPLTAPGQTANIAAAMKKAAEMAMIEAGQTNVTLITKDTAGNPQTAAAAAQAAIAEGAEIILGPLLGSEVAAVAPIAKAHNIPVIAFSSVSRVAQPGIYLMSFLPEQEVSNLLRHVSQNGIRTIAAMIPNSQYGAVVERALKTSASSMGITIVATERFSRNGQNLSAISARIVRAVNSPSNPARAVFIPEGGQLLRAVGTSLAQAGFSPRSVKVLGTGLWDSPLTNGTPIAIGGWYAGVSPQRVQAFNQRYSATYQTNPPRIASLAYDALSLTLSFARTPIGTRFTAAQITNVEGYNGVNGLFRFRPDGRIERGLSILEVSASGTGVASTAPSKFSFGF